MEYENFIEAAARQIRHGAFLMTGDEANPMTISWCQWGRVWEKPVCTIFVRKSRFSHELIENGRFTVSVPEPGTFVKELAFCGSRSGRDTDKLGALNIMRLKLGENGVDGVDGCAAHFECRVVFKCESDLDLMDGEIRKEFYGPANAPDEDLHTVYFGEIIAVHGKKS